MTGMAVPPRPVRIRSKNLVGLSLGIDLIRPALKLPALGRLGLSRP
jgi:hypothetical protein